MDARHCEHPGRPGREDTYTATGGLVRLVVGHGGEVLGGVVVECPLPWVYRRPYLRPEDVE